MNTSLNWLKEYVPALDCAPDVFADALTMSGSKVETWRALDKNLDKIVTGKLTEIRPHPDADKLVVCQVDVGQGTPLQIVTGAANVREGDIVPVVLDGGRVAGGHDGSPLPEDGVPIKAGKLRGVESMGMLCSIEELGSSREFYPEAPENGIYIFPPETPVGEDAPTLLGLRDTVFEYEITSNRVDCYSVLGIAREAATTFRLPFVAPKEDGHSSGGNRENAENGENKESQKGEAGKGSIESKESKENRETVEDYLSVEVLDTELCPRYTARVVKNIRIAPSPKWMQVRLMTAGIRPINNLVDITNYVMLEYGQPMHAYDYDLVRGHKIIVQRAKDGDVFETLDQQERKLDHTVLTICDAEGAIGVAGIMGGQNSKITDSVKTMVFEAACFDGPNIRQSARKIGDRTEASGYFEKGLDPNLAELAINRACQLVEELQCGDVVEGMADVYPQKRLPVTVTCTASQINDLLGTSLSVEEMAEILRRDFLEVAVEGETFQVTAPTFRQDIHRMCDVAEEVARFYGYDRIPVTLPSGNAAGGLSPVLQIHEQARHLAEALGYSQAYLYSFESPKAYDRLLFPGDAPERKQVRIANPLGEDFSVMRTTSLHGMLTALSTNYNRRNKEARLYELANIYLPHSLPLAELPEERPQLTLGAYGGEEALDFFTMKGVVETLLEKLGLHGRFRYDAKSCDRPFLHPGRKADIYYGEKGEKGGKGGQRIGYLGEVHPEVLDNYAIGDRAYVAVLDMPAIYPHAGAEVKYAPLGRFPAVTRDFSMLVPLQVTAGEIEDMLVQRAGKLMEEVRLFDLYTGAQILAGYKSMAYTVTLRAKDHTLTEEEINSTVKKILNGLQRLGIELRS